MKLALLVLLFATTAARADAPKEVSDADAARFLAMFDKIVDTAVADKDHCDKMAADLNAVLDVNKDVIEMANKAKADGKTLPAAAKQRVTDGVARMLPAVQSCQSSDAVKKAFGRLEIKKK